MKDGAGWDVLEAARQRDDRQGYLGDWHSHPVNVGPSPLDRRTLGAIAKDSTARSAMPLLCLLRRGEDGKYTTDIWRWTPVGLMTTRIIMAGGLPAEDGGHDASE